MNSQLLSYEKASSERRAKILENVNARIQKREETFQTGQQKWDANQHAKKDRKTRDLQFELALGTKRTLNIKNKNQRHQVDQESGIDTFEMNLKRSGIGGDVDEGGSLLPSAEDSSIFMNRLELNANKDWPTDGEVGDFKQVLEKRTKELRVARAEKARRKRRMLVDQDTALGNMVDSVVEEEDYLQSTLCAQQLKTNMLKLWRRAKTKCVYLRNKLACGLLMKTVKLRKYRLHWMLKRPEKQIKKYAIMRCANC